MVDEKYSISSPSHTATSKYLFENLLTDDEFSDVTLFCDDDDRVIKSHRSILSAFSPFFRNILRKLTVPGGSIYLSGVKSKFLSSILEYMHKGETLVQERDLASFIECAEKLQVLGIYPVANFQQKKIASLSQTNYNGVFTEKINASNLFETNYEIKIEPEILIKQEEDDISTEASGIENDFVGEGKEYSKMSLNEEKIKPDNNKFHTMKNIVTQNCATNDLLKFSGLSNRQLISCKYCQFKTRRSFILKKHIHRLHSKASRKYVSCHYCGKTFDNSEALNKHKSTNHNVIKA